MHPLEAIARDWHYLGMARTDRNQIFIPHQTCCLHSSLVAVCVGNDAMQPCTYIFGPVQEMPDLKDWETFPHMLDYLQQNVRLTLSPLPGMRSVIITKQRRKIGVYGSALPNPFENMPTCNECDHPLLEKEDHYHCYGCGIEYSKTSH